MMTKQSIFYTVLFLTIVLFSCENKNPKYTISGTVSPEKNGDLIMLFKYRGDSIFAVDTTYINKGTFKFKGDETLDDIAIVATGNYPGIVRSAEVVLDRGAIDVSLDSVSTVRGTPLNDALIAYKKTLEMYSDSIKTIWSKNESKNEAVPDPAYDSMIKKEHEFQFNWVKANLCNPIGRREFKKWTNNLMPIDLYDLYEATPDKYKSDPELKIPFEKKKRSEEIGKQREQSVGKKYIDFELRTLENENKKLSDYVGKSKYLFIEFTASWCGPCRADMPHLKKSFDKYKDNGLAVISISLDTDIRKWKRFISESDAPWTHLSNLKGKPSELTKAYNVYGIPDGVLLDQEGTILAVRLRGQSLSYVMDNILMKQNNNK